jgi:hypothetical protein
MIAELIVRPGHVALGYAERLLKDIKPETFARKPKFEECGILDINHPAFCYGHLALYPVRLLDMLGLDRGPIDIPERYNELFAAGKDCLDDPDGTIYPSFDEVTQHFFTGYRHTLEVLRTVPDTAFQAPNPVEGRFKEMLPTLGEVASFMTSAHVMMHMGQVSAWRRCFGLGPAM